MDDKNPKTTTQQPAADPAQVPVSAPHKEAEVPPVSNFVKHSETEPVLDEEVEKAGVEKISEELKITPEHEQIGIRPGSDSIQPSLEPSGAVRLPMTEEEALKIIKTDKNLADSLLWLAKLIERIYQQIRLLAKKSLTG